jgi:hypothetical protein
MSWVYLFTFSKFLLDFIFKKSTWCFFLGGGKAELPIILGKMSTFFLSGLFSEDPLRVPTNQMLWNWIPDFLLNHFFFILFCNIQKQKIYVYAASASFFFYCSIIIVNSLLAQLHKYLWIQVLLLDIKYNCHLSDIESGQLFFKYRQYSRNGLVHYIQNLGTGTGTKKRLSFLTNYLHYVNMRFLFCLSLKHKSTPVFSLLKLKYKDR